MTSAVAVYSLVGTMPDWLTVTSSDVVIHVSLRSLVDRGLNDMSIILSSLLSWTS